MERKMSSQHHDEEAGSTTSLLPASHDDDDRYGTEKGGDGGTGKLIMVRGENATHG